MSGKYESNYKALADLNVERLNIEKRQEELGKILDGLSITVNDIAGVIEIWTGIPASEIKAGELAVFRTQTDDLGIETNFTA